MYIHQYKNRKIYYWADLHYGHDRDFIWGPRGFKNVGEQDARIRQELLALRQDYTLALLGDTILGPNAEERFLDLIDSVIPCQEILVMPGNHDSGYRQARKRFGRQWDSNGKRIQLISNLEEMMVENRPIVLSHYPLRSWNGARPDKPHRLGAWHIHGHVHGHIEDSLPNKFDGGKILDVGLESCPKPVSFDEVEAIMEKKPFYQVDHHGGDTQNSF